MQIFMPSDNFVISAIMLDDKRLNKQAVESIQIVSTALWVNDCQLGETATSIGAAYLPSHEHHPLIKWAAEHPDHCVYVLQFTHACCMEFQTRFSHLHTCNKRIRQLFPFVSKMIEHGPVRPQPNATTNHKHIDDLHEAYYQELILKWVTDKMLPKWTNQIPAYDIRR